MNRYDATIASLSAVEIVIKKLLAGHDGIIARLKDFPVSEVVQSYEGEKRGLEVSLQVVRDEILFQINARNAAGLGPEKLMDGPKRLLIDAE